MYLKHNSIKLHVFFKRLFSIFDVQKAGLPKVLGAHLHEHGFSGGGS